MSTFGVKKHSTGQTPHWLYMPQQKGLEELGGSKAESLIIFHDAKECRQGKLTHLNLLTAVAGLQLVLEPANVMLSQGVCTYYPGTSVCMNPEIIQREISTSDFCFPFPDKVLMSITLVSHLQQNITNMDNLNFCSYFQKSNLGKNNIVLF